MPDLMGIQRQVQERLDELEQQISELGLELEQLRQVGAILENGGRAAAPASRARRAPAARASRPARAAAPADGRRAQRGGNRALQALKLIEAQPGLTAAQLADSMGMKRNYLYRVLPALEKDGKIAKQGKGYHKAT